MFGGELIETIYLYDNRGRNYVDVEFSPMDAVYDTQRGIHIVTPANLKLTYFGEEERNKDVIEAAKASEVECLIISNKAGKVVHYTI